MSVGFVGHQLPAVGFVLEFADLARRFEIAVGMPRVDHDEVGVIWHAILVAGDAAAVAAVVVRTGVMREPRMHEVG